ncbi:glycoside hydrolase family 26 protein [Pedobacter mendelii]|uniref:Mannan endo-1,4-beta-mannosidase n=1 Tax=Pedobacter mendelii TaxID=1908240 RepID=A0ABQ2BG06_9SPHI|nr:glycosyl hydrolase [Pedobacter mendelii]GGI25338.1 mannan endo-1,4-beta-mannosidase [Pedobacter mendelii]
MIKKIIPFFMFLCMSFIAVFGQLIDKKATLQTKNLYKNLINLSGKEVLFGHQDDLAYGVGWQYQAGKSDIKDLTGEYPAVFGWDISGLETNQKQNIDGVPFAKMKEYMKNAYDLGTINTLSWHMDNPVNGKTSWDTSSISVKSILPNGSKHLLYTGWLDKFSVFAKSLKGTDGKAIPILFRPFHENGGGWFWWGAKSCTPQEYKALWQFTVKYLRDKKQLHNLIYVFNPCDFKTEEQYLERYPGNEFVDVLSFDSYQYGGIEKGESFKLDIAKKLTIQSIIAKENKKLSAIAEIGFVEIPDANWWTNVFLKSIEANKPSYVLFWRNAGYREKEKDNHYYAPYPGQVSATDFLKLVKANKVLLQKGLKKYSIYN